MRMGFILCLFNVFATSAGAVSGVPVGAILQQGQTVVSLEEALAKVLPGQVVVLGEHHGSLEQAHQQMQVLETIRKNGHLVSIGMEFFDYPKQHLVEAYRTGALDEASFLTQIEWGSGFSYDAYRNQVLFPQYGTEHVVALNAPRSLTGRISKVGIQGLTAEEKLLLPPNWTVGNDSYRERFATIMGGHISPEALQRYFEAQSTWDDTMAWRAAQFLAQNPEQVLVIIVGEFHVQYGGGLPDRLKARGLQAWTFSLLNLEGLSEVEQNSEVQPSSQYGARADFVWTSKFTLGH